MLDESLKFLKLLREFERVERAIFRTETKQENDVEHSYQLAMMSWFLATKYELPLSMDKMIRYALVHDLVEVYAGDTPSYAKNTSKNTHATKKQREEEALVRIKNEFGDFKEMIDAIDAYEAKVDDESVFVYEVDKIIPALNIYIDDGFGWNKLGLTLDEIKLEKRTKVKSTKQLVDLLEEMLSRFEKEKGKLFTVVK